MFVDAPVDIILATCCEIKRSTYSFEIIERPVFPRTPLLLIYSSAVIKFSLAIQHEAPVLILPASASACAAASVGNSRIVPVMAAVPGCLACNTATPALF